MKIKKCRHKLKNKTLCYIQHIIWIEKQVKKGRVQTQCPVCKLWLFKCEL